MRLTRNRLFSFHAGQRRNPLPKKSGWIAAGVAMLCVLVAAPAFAEVTIDSALVKSGFFLAPDCAPTANPKLFNECICKADIKKPVVSGIAPGVAASINTQLALLPEKLAAESCEGTSTAAPPAGMMANEVTANYIVAYQTPRTLTLLTTYATQSAGGAHPLSGTEGMTFDLATGQLVDPVARLKPEQLRALDSFIQQALVKKYPSDLFEEARARSEPYISENGCDSCTVFYGKEGWMVRFQVYAIAPYAVGEPEIAVPAELIPSPETLMTQTKS